MFDCSSDVRAFHNEEVTLPSSEQKAMRERRDANRKRLKRGLNRNAHPLPKEFKKQGSYATLTMVQDPDNDYDIDDGVYFDADALLDNDGYSLEPKAVRQRVRDSVADEQFKKQPRVLRNCVRVFYDAGYHVDLPVYRIRTSDGEYELAGGDEWTVSRAADVTDWFNDVNQSKSPDEENGRQFRRIVRLLKKFARSRTSWKNKIASGFIMTKLAEECYVPDGLREDVALRQTMESVHGRLQDSLEVWHPTTAGTRLTSGPDDETTAFLRDKLADALEDLHVLDDANCDEDAALDAWSSVFNTEFFSSRKKEKKTAAAGNIAILGRLTDEPREVKKQGGRRYA